MRKFVEVLMATLPCLLLGSVAVSSAVAAPEEVAPGLKVGDVLDQSNWQLAKDLLPPEVLRHYEKGEYRNRIVAVPPGNVHWEQTFVDATEKNAGQLDVDAVGSIIYKGTGKQPDSLYGLPFPVIDPTDPKAGVKVVWNQFLAYWNGGSTFNNALVTMLGPKGIDRDIVADGWFLFFDGQSPKYRKPNPLNLQSQFLGVATSPADLQGTASLSWRYRDPGKRDSQWAFVPALRRVRAVSPANRSDGYLGSDVSPDDGFFFDGKPEDFEWTLIGKRDGLRIVDPNTLAANLEVKPAPDGGWISLTDLNPPTVGYRTPGWTGLSWAPTDPTLAKRTFWVAQGVPRDKYYLYGKIELWIDAESWDGAWNRKFSWSGELMHNYQVTGRVNQPAGPPQEREWVPVTTMIWQCAENIKMNRATLSGMRPTPASAFYRRAKIDENVFDPMTLNRFGK